MFSKGKAKKKVAPGGRLAGPSAPSILSGNLTISGNLTCDGEIQIDGTVEGDVKCARLTVGESGHIRGSVITDVALIRGSVSGEIRAGKVHMTASSRVYGDVLHETLMIEPGALIEGHCRRVDGHGQPQEAPINLIVDQTRPNTA